MVTRRLVNFCHGVLLPINETLRWTLEITCTIHHRSIDGKHNHTSFQPRALEGALGITPATPLRSLAGGVAPWILVRCARTPSRADVDQRRATLINSELYGVLGLRFSLVLGYTRRQRLSGRHLGTMRMPKRQGRIYVSGHNRRSLAKVQVPSIMGLWLSLESRKSEIKIIVSEVTGCLPSSVFLISASV